jgi:hypothetical protein
MRQVKFYTLIKALQGQCSFAPTRNIVVIICTIAAAVGTAASYTPGLPSTVERMTLLASSWHRATDYSDGFSTLTSAAAAAAAGAS